MRATKGTVLLAHYSNTKTTKPTRKCTMIEVYSDLYYKTNFAEQVRKEVEETTPNYTESKQECSARKMSIYRRWRETSWDAEDDEVKAHVRQVYDDDVTTSNDLGNRQQS